MSKDEADTIVRLAERLRALGVRSFTGEGVSISFGPPPAEAPAPLPRTKPSGGFDEAIMFGHEGVG